MAGILLSIFVLFMFLLIPLLIFSAVAWVVMVVRAAISDRLSKKQKIWWILGMVLFPPVAFIYMLVVERHWLWRTLGILFLLAGIVGMGGMVVAGAQKGEELIDTAHNHAHFQDTEEGNADLKAVRERIKKLDDWLEAKSKEHEGSTDGKSMNYVMAGMRLTSLQADLIMEKVTIQQANIYMDEAEKLAADGDISDEDLATMKRMKQEYRAAKPGEE